MELVTVGLEGIVGTTIFCEAVVGFDIKTVAELVGRSEGSVRVLSHRGLARLAELIEKSRKNSNELDSSGTSKEGR